MGDEGSDYISDEDYQPPPEENPHRLSLLEVDTASDPDTGNIEDIDSASEPESLLSALVLQENMGNLALRHRSHRGNNQPCNGDEASSSDQTFNEDLPAIHSYLGENLEEVTGRMIYTECQCVTIPLISGSYGVLLPGQTFPLTVRDPSQTDMLRKCVEGDHTFGCIAGVRNTAGIGQTIYGTTAEIYEFLDENNTVRIKAKGRQRFRLIKTRWTNYRYRMAEVYILPEIKLPHPFTTLYITSLNGLRSTQTEKCRRFEANLLTWPKWLYDMYDTEKLVKKAEALTMLKQGLRTDKGLSMIPKDPTELSFWMASHVDAEARLYILTLNCPIPRLRWLISFFSKHQHYVCVSCETKIGQQNDVFAMSIEGAQSTYVNSDGYHHDTLTLLKADNILPITPLSTHFSWFPGYAWSIAVCRQCQKHLGWQFVSVKKNLRPDIFWGLTRQSLETRLCTED